MAPARFLLFLLDCLLAPFVFFGALLLLIVRRLGIHRMPASRRTLMTVGVYPVIKHYYDPLFDYRDLRLPVSAARSLPGIDWNVPGQLNLLRQLPYAEELVNIAQSASDSTTFHFNNGSFESGDAEFLYAMIRLVKPRRLVEIGSGNSTLIAQQAIRRNMSEEAHYHCRHVCVEPYEMPWLETQNVVVVRKRVEELGVTFFTDLEPNDILFIDSSHIIRPQGDVLFEYLELLPSLPVGVIVHIHDIFSPRDYLSEWLSKRVRLWNEQYLLEAFLSGNKDWQVMAALNYLHHQHPAALKKVCPYLEPEREPGSFYMKRIKARQHNGVIDP